MIKGLSHLPEYNFLKMTTTMISAPLPPAHGQKKAKDRAADSKAERRAKLA